MFKELINKKLIFALIIISAFIIPNKILAQTIDKIELSGVNSANYSDITDNLPVAVGDEINKDTSDEIIQSIFSMGIFEDIEVSIDNGIINIYVVEKPYIKSIKVSNYATGLIDKKKMNEYLINYGLEEGSIYSEKNLLNLRKFLKNIGEEEGFLNFSVEEKIDINAENKASIRLILRTGKQAEIKSIHIEGANAYTEKEILKILEIGVTPSILASFFTSKDKYAYKKLELETQRMVYFYQDRGYYDFAIKGVDIDISDDKRKVYIIIKIEEGAKYTLGNINFIGDLQDKTADDLLAMFDIKKGDLFKRDKLIEGIGKINSFYQNIGYAYLELKYTTFIKPEAEIDLTIEIIPGEKVYVNKIYISGNDVTKDKVIRREIDLLEDSVYSINKIDKSILNIKKLGLFSSVKVEKKFIEGSENKIDLNFVVQERKTGSVGLGLSHSESSGLSIDSNLQERNFLGSGNTVKLEIKYSKEYNQTSLFFRNPHINEKRHSFSYNMFLSTKESSTVSADSYLVNKTGFDIGYGIPLDEESRLSAMLEYRKQELKCGDTFVEKYEPTQCSSTDNNEILLGLNWNKNTLNDYSNPTAGQENNVKVDISLPHQAYQYFKIDARHRSYSKITENITLKLFAELGLIKDYGDGYAPFYRRYYGGGKKLRGFKNSTVSPSYEDSTKLKGGDFKVLGSANLISPLGFIEDSDNMRISAFVDMGNVYDEISLDIEKLRMSAGASFYYLSPIGGIGVYVATPIFKQEEDQIETFAFYLDNEF